MAETRSTGSWIIRWVIISVVIMIVLKFVGLTLLLAVGAGFVAGALFSKPSAG